MCGMLGVGSGWIPELTPERAETMEYRFSESAYVGKASDGTIVRVDESEFAEAVHDLLKGRGVNLNDANYNERYNEARDDLSDADEWVGLIGDNPNVTAD